MFFFQDKKADLKINYYVDEVMKRVMQKLGLEIPEYKGFRPEKDPTLCNSVLEESDEESSEEEEDKSIIKPEDRGTSNENSQRNGQIVHIRAQKLENLKREHAEDVGQCCLDDSRAGQNEETDGSSDIKKQKLDASM